MWRLVLGIVLAPLSTPLAILVLFTVEYLLGLGWFNGKDYSLVITSAWVYAWFATPLAYSVALLLAIPSFLWFRRRGWLSFLHAVGAGTLLGTIPFFLFDLWVLGHDIVSSFRWGWRHESFGLISTMARLVRDVPIALIWAGMGAWCGAVAAACFWCLAIRGYERGRM